MPTLPEASLAPKTHMQQIRRWVVGVIIASFGVAALGGIVVLLSGTWSDTAGKVLGTTALTGVFSVAVLCGVALLGKRAQWFGWITIAASAATLARLLWLIWAEPSWGDRSFELSLSMIIITTALAVISLLLLLSAHDRTTVRVLLYLTVGLIALGVLLSLLAVWGFAPEDPENFWRGTGVVWILAALGVVILPVMSLLLRVPKSTRAAPQPGPQPAVDAASTRDAASPLAAQPAPQLSPATLERLAATARAEGITPNELVDRILPPR